MSLYELVIGLADITKTITERLIDLEKKSLSEEQGEQIIRIAQEIQSAHKL